MVTENMLGNIDIEKLEAIKAELFEKGSDPLMSYAYLMIKELENLIVTMTLNHQHYCQWAAKEIKRYKDRIIEDSWTKNPDRMGGQFTDEEINRSDNW